MFLRKKRYPPEHTLIFESPTMPPTRYNIALLATHPEPYTQVAQDHFASCAHGYLLGKNSLPHVTVCQFYAEDSSLGPLVEALKKADQCPTVQLTGLEFSKNKKEANVWGTSLSVARMPDLMALHHFVVQLLQRHQLPPLNSIGDLYRPHLTLARIRGLNVQNFSSDILQEAAVQLVLGESDEEGQLIRVMHQI